MNFFKSCINLLLLLTSLAPYGILFLWKSAETTKSFKEILFTIGSINISYVWFYSIAGLLEVILFIKLLLICYTWVISSDTLKIKSIKPAEQTYIPIYIGYFVIALGIPDFEAFIFLTIVLIASIIKTKVFFFNILMLFLGYNFYEVISEKGVNILLITKKKDLKNISKFNELIRINNFTFLDIEVKE